MQELAGDRADRMKFIKVCDFSTGNCQDIMPDLPSK